MLGSRLPAAALQWAPAAAAASHSSITGQLLQATIPGPCSSSSSGSGGGGGSTTAGAGVLQLQRFFRTGVWDVRSQRRRKSEVYFNPDDGPDAYSYWRDLWRKEAPKPKAPKPKRPPLYLEQEEQDALVAAAIGAGVPEGVVMGDTRGQAAPRLVRAIQAHGGRIPTRPAALSERIHELLELERTAPGLDVMRIFKANGFAILARSPGRVATQLRYLRKQLPAAGVAAEPGLVFTAAPKPAMQQGADMVQRAVELPEVFESTLGVPAPAHKLMSHSFGATLVNRSTAVLQRHMRALVDSHGPEAAARMASGLPQLLHFRPQTLALKTLALAEGLGLSSSPEAAQALVAREPRLLTHGAKTLAARLAGLRDLLGYDGTADGTAQLAEAVRGQPSLLHKRTGTLADKLAALQQLLGLPRDQTLDLVRARPGLLCHATASLAAAVRQAGEALGRQPDSPFAAAVASSEVSSLFVAQPALLCLNADPQVAPRASLGARLQLLHDLAHCGKGWESKVAALVSPGNDVTNLALALAHRQLHPRLSWVVQQQQQPQPGGGSVSSGGLLAMLDAPEAEFEEAFPGFAAWHHEQQQHKGGWKSSGGGAARSSGSGSSSGLEEGGEPVQ